MVHSVLFYLRLNNVEHMETEHPAREEHPFSHYVFRLAARVLLYAPYNRQDSTYHGLCYTSREALAGRRNISK